jgi:hypothetical protein
MAIDWDTILSALSGGVQGGMRGYAQGEELRSNRQRDDLARQREQREQNADFDQANYRASQALNEANAGFDKKQDATAKRGRLAKGNRAILATTPEGKAAIDALGANADDVLGEYEGSAIDDILRNLRPPPPKREPIDRFSPEGVAAQQQIDTERAKLRTKYPTPRANSGNEDRTAITSLLGGLNSQIDDARSDVTRLSKPIREAAEAGVDVEAADTAGLGDARSRMTTLGGQRDMATKALMQSNPVLARLFASDSAGAAPPPPVTPPPAGFQRQGPPRGVAQPLGEKEKFKARSDPKFRAFLMRNGYTDGDWK